MRWDELGAHRLDGLLLGLVLTLVVLAIASTLKLPLVFPSAWIVMPGSTVSPSSNPSRSMSKCASPMP